MRYYDKKIGNIGPFEIIGTGNPVSAWDFMTEQAAGLFRLTRAISRSTITTMA